MTQLVDAMALFGGSVREFDGSDGGCDGLIERCDGSVGAVGVQARDVMAQLGYLVAQ